MLIEVPFFSGAIAGPNPACIDLSSQCHDRVEVVGLQCWNERTGNDHTYN